MKRVLLLGLVLLGTALLNAGTPRTGETEPVEVGCSSLLEESYSLSLYDAVLTSTPKIYFPAITSVHTGIDGLQEKEKERRERVFKPPTCVDKILGSNS